MLMFSIRIDLDLQAESFDYVEEKAAKLEDVISSHFDEDELVGFDLKILQQMRDDANEEEYADEE
ncbi:MAG: hypothetical protein SWE60_21610 [Thermodesulfobacteriota bacterium]|nr:hypothetical protein [Thermodesulfobacteriota bacterium]